MAADQTLRLHVVLPLRDEAALESFVRDVNDPAAANYRRFLTPAEFTERFGPSERDYAAASRYFQSNGLKIVGGSRDGMDFQLEGSVSVIETSFHVSMGVYRHPTENRNFYSPDREPTTGLSFHLWHVSGLDNFDTPRPNVVSKAEYAKAHGMKEEELTPAATTGSGPSASYLGSDMRAAYYGGTALTGAGQTMGLFEYLGTQLSDVNTYLANTGQTNTVPITLLSTDGTSTSCLYSGTALCDDTEQTLDITQAIGMAPGLANLVVFIGSSDTAILSSMTTHTPLAATIGCSWSWSPADPATDNPYFLKMAAQGQNFFVASGDHSTWASGNIPWPADSQYVISVGGTSLVTASAGGAWKSETAWVNSGGGISPDSIAIPSWQKTAGVITSTNKGSTTLRNGPDVSANADYTFYVCSKQTACTANSYGGTSFAAPMWAAYAALVNQQNTINGHAALGFLNPAIYTAAESSGYKTYFHDITSGTSGSFSATAGFDLVTGWGSPNGLSLISVLANTPTPPDFTLSAAPSSLSVAQGATGTATLTTAVTGGFNNTIALTASGLPTGVTASFSPAGIAAPGSGSSTLTLSVASTAVAGTYSINVTGTNGSTTHTAAVTLTVTVPAFTISDSPSSLSVAQGNTGTSRITTSVSGGFNSAVALSVSGLPTGVTASFSSATIAAPGSGSSTLTLSVASTVATGAYTIVVTGAGGGATHTASITLNVTAPPSFTLTVPASTISVTRGKQGTATITTTVAGGFSSRISLSASGLPSGVSASFSPGSISSPGSGSSTLTLTVASTAAVGTYPITVTASGGGITHTATVTLTVQ